jgi:hypothetical protein
VTKQTSARALRSGIWRRCQRSGRSHLHPQCFRRR